MQPRPNPAPHDALPERHKVAAIILAAGRSSRMGSNKLLAPVRGKPLVRHAAEAALASRAAPVIVVTGNEAERVEAALSPLALLYERNHLFSDGLSASLKRGVRSVPSETEAVVVLLGDMPDIAPDLINSLIDAFEPDAGRAICVPVWRGQRGNPVLWGRSFFKEILALEGDVGARALMARHPHAVCEVQAGDHGILLDIDTPQALAEYNKP